MAQKRGRPATGRMPKANFRLPPEILEIIDELIGQLGCKSRSDVIRKVVGFGFPLFQIKAGNLRPREQAAALRSILEGND